MMSQCPKPGCSSTSFEMKELDVRNARYRLHAIQCAYCGAVVTVHEAFSVVNLLDQIAGRLGMRFRA